MPIGFKSHARITDSLSGLSKDELKQLAKEFEDMFAEIEIKKSAGLEAGYSKKEIEVAVEGYVKIDAAEKGKGWLYRSRKRNSLLLKLL